MQYLLARLDNIPSCFQLDASKKKGKTTKIQPPFPFVKLHKQLSRVFKCLQSTPYLNEDIYEIWASHYTL